MATPSRSSGGDGSGGLSVNDPVSVEVSDSTQPLQGVVAHLGPVKFSPDADWVGVRLTGASAGKGKNDGSVRGVRYFGGCGANGGVFVRRGAVSRRTLTRLEELRLKRELASAGATSSSDAGAPSAAAGSAAPPSSATKRASGLATPSASSKARSSVKAPSSASSAAPPSSAGGTATTKSRSRLDEIRERRAALAKKGSSGSSTDVASASSSAAASTAKTPVAAKTPKKLVQDLPPKTPSSTSTPASSGAKAAAATPAAAAVSSAEDKAEIASLKEQLTSLTTEKSSLQAALAEAEQRAHDARAEAERARVDEEKARTTAAAALAVVAEKKRAEEEAAGGGDKDEGEKAVVEAGAVATEGEAPAAGEEELRLRLSSVRSDLEDAESKAKDLERSLAAARSECDRLHRELDAERDGRTSDAESKSSELAAVRGKLTAAERELAARDERDSSHDASEKEHYRERARVQAELAAARRRVHELEADAVEKDTALEELALDKEALAEEKEGLEDRLEEMKIDLESAQLELDEARADLEAERERAEARGGGGGGEGATAAAGDADDVARALSSQNARLREALLRLREQSAQEKMELSRQVRSAKRDAEKAASDSKEVRDLRALREKMEVEVRDLKEMVDQNGAYEGMVEDLSDRVMGLEDDNAGLRATVREMEEAADVAAEMEEVQAEENRQLMRDLEGRDAALRNLEEAIKMQRRREEEFQKTVGNFRSTVETLKQEKSSLLALQEGSGDEHSRLVAQSHRALARAARLVSEAARSRKRDADAAFHGVEAASNGHAVRRLEAVLPSASAAASAEAAAIRGEMALARVAAKAAAALAGVEAVCAETVRKGAEYVAEKREESGEDAAPVPTEGTLPVADEQSQRVRTALHQADFADAAVDVASDCSRLLAAGQWPDLLPPRSSAELGAAALHVLPPVEAALDRELRTLKEEGGLSPHRSKLSELVDCARDARGAIADASNAEGDPVVPQGWVPPGWEAVRTASRAKFYGLCAAAALAAPLAGEEDGGGGWSSSTGGGGGASEEEASARALCAALAPVLGRVDKVNSESGKVCRQLSGLNVVEEKQIEEVDRMAKEWLESSRAVFASVKSLLSGKEMDLAKVADCNSAADEALRLVSKVSSYARANKIVAEEGQIGHALSPESRDPWNDLSRLARKVRVVSGDEDDLNYIVRAHAVEAQLTEAIDNETKLSISNARVVSLEKSLASRSREIGLQNARLAELEDLLSRTAATEQPPSKSPAGKAAKSSSSDEEAKALREENRVLTEAMETFQAQVDEYEKEIKTLKSFGRLGGVMSSAKKTPRKSASFGAESFLSPGGVGPADGAAAAGPKALAFEAALFRPALSAARSDAARWKARSVGDAVLGLPPLSVPKPGKQSTSSSSSSDAATAGRDCAEELLRASSQLRLARASFAVVDLSKGGGGGRPSRPPPRGGTRSRLQLRAELRKTASAADRLEDATRAAHDLLAKMSSSAGGAAANPAPPASSRGFVSEERGRLLGKLSLPGGETNRVVPLVVNRHELRSVHSQLLQ